MALLAAVLWWWLSAAAIRVHVVASVSDASNAAGWSCEWTGAGTGERHGAWAELNDDAPEVLEVEVSGIPHDPGTPFEFWLYRVTSDTEESPDLVTLLDAPQTKETRKWIPFEQGPGIIFVGQGSGQLSVPIKGRTIQVGHAKTPRGGNVTLRYRGENVTIDCYSATGMSNTVLLPSPIRVVPAGELRQRLPAYRVSEAFVSWDAPPGTTIGLSGARERYTFGGVGLFQRNLTVAAAADVEAVGESQWRATGPHPSVRLTGKWRARAWCHAAGVGATWVGLAVVALGVPPAWRLGKRLLLRRTAALLLGAVVVVGVHAAVAAWSPVIVTADGMDYIDSADTLARTATFQGSPLYKAPGLSVVVAFAMLLSENFLRSYGWVACVLSICTALMAWELTRRRCGFWWALAAGVLVGISPTLMVYQSYMLRELPSAAVLMAAALALLLVRDRLRAGGSAWIATIMLAAACAAGAYMRENLQLLVPLAPVLVLLPGAGGWRPRALRAAVVLLGSAALLTPRIMVVHKKYGNYGVVQPKIEGNRLLSSWANRVGDGNDTALATREQWQQFLTEHLTQPKSDYNFSELILNNSLLAKKLGSTDAGPSTPLISEEIARAYMREATARSPIKAARAAARAFASQVGLWNFQTGTMGDVAAANEWYSQPLRGEALPFASNYSPDTVTAMYNVRLTTHQDRIKELIAQSRRSVKTLEDAPATRLFNELFYCERLLRPVLAVLFLAGVFTALRRRDFTFAGIGLIALLSMVGAAVVVGTPTDRFSVPFIPIMVCMAVYALSNVRWGGRREETTEAAE